MIADQNMGSSSGSLNISPGLLLQMDSVGGVSSSSVGSLSKSPSDLDDLNRTLYDIGAQDLLDVWDAMESEVRNRFLALLIIRLDFELYTRSHLCL